jgi:hypothetical protein
VGSGFEWGVELKAALISQGVHFSKDEHRCLSMNEWINSSVLPAIALQARQRAALWLKQNLLPYRPLDGIEYTRELQ